MIKNKEKGQALLVVVLVMIVALTVGLSLTSRSIVSLRTSSEEADSQKALAAAEAGIEQALKINIDQTLTGSFNENATTYSTIIKEAKGTDPILVNGGSLVLQDDGADIWLVSHTVTADDAIPNYSLENWTGDLTMYWGDVSLDDCSNSALEVAVISNAAPYSLKRYVYDPCELRRSGNNFALPTTAVTSIGTMQFKYQITNVISSGLVVRVVPIYTNSAIAVKGSVALPSQGFYNESTGLSGLGDRQVARSISRFRTYKQLATQYFLYGLFSP